MGEWEFPDQQQQQQQQQQLATTTIFNKPIEDNKIVGHIIQRLHDICYPVQPGSPKPVLPVFPLKAIVLGKPFSGKTSALKIVGESN